ncbi:MAG: hypothetical protein JKY43_09245 [Phycisphaerales bacterium]|nr:hypothetical protein [Phycisphaerales bacterium]
MKNRNTIIALAITSAATMAHADIADPGVYSPFNNAQAKITFIGSSAGYTGVMNWINPDISASVALLNNHESAIGDSVILPTIFQAGERIDFSYEVIRGGLDLFETSDAADWAQFRVDASDPANVWIGVEDIRLPGGDSDYNDAVFQVSFIQVVPTPGSMTLMSAGVLMVSRRRR